MNIERIAAVHTLVVVDDIFPNHPAQAARRRRTRIWAGDVWKLFTCLRQNRPDLFLQPLDVSYTGLLLIAGLDPANRVLRDGYNRIVRAFAADAPPPEAILSREGAIGAEEEQLQPILSAVRRARAENPSRSDFVKALRAAVAQTATVSAE